MKRLFAVLFSTLLFISLTPFALAAESTSVKTPASKAVIQQTININTADVETLTQLKGIGTKKAEAIIAWREQNGGFTSVEQLLEIKGIGAATLDANRQKIQI